MHEERRVGRKLRIRHNSVRYHIKMSEKDVEHKSGLEKEMREVYFSPDAGPTDGRRRSSWARKGSLARSDGWQKRDAFASVDQGKEGGDGKADINYQTLAWW